MRRNQIVIECDRTGCDVVEVCDVGNVTRERWLSIIVRKEGSHSEEHYLHLCKKHSKEFLATLTKASMKEQK